MNRFLTLCVVLASAVLSVFADNDSTTTTLPDFMLVGKTRPYEEVIPAQHLDGKSLEQLNSHNVADAIRYFSGVQMSPSAACRRYFVHIFKKQRGKVHKIQLVKGRGFWYNLCVNEVRKGVRPPRSVACT